MRRLTDNEIFDRSVFICRNSGTISEKGGKASPGGLYDFSLFGGTVCFCGNPIFPGDICSCGVFGISYEDALLHGAVFPLPFRMITEKNLKFISDNISDVNVPRTIEALWHKGVDGCIGGDLLNELAKMYPIVSEYTNRFLYIVNPIFRMFAKDEFGKFMPDDYTRGISVFIDSCKYIDSDEKKMKLNKMYSLLLTPDAVSAGKEYGLRGKIRENIIEQCLSRVIIPNPKINVNEIGLDEEYNERAILIRYPILHKHNLVALNVKKIDYAKNCIHLHPLTVQPFGGDFDGDTMQVIPGEFSSSLHIESNMIYDKNGKNIFKYKKEYEKYEGEDYEKISKKITEEGIPLFDFSNKACSLRVEVPSVNFDALFEPMYGCQNSLVDGLSISDFVNLSVKNRNILEVKQDLVAVSGYNTRQLVLACWGKSISVATAFTESMTQKALSLKHGGERNFSIKVNQFPLRKNGIDLFNDFEYFLLKDARFDGDNLWYDFKIFSSIFPLMRMFNFKLGASNSEYIKEFKKFSPDICHALKGGILTIYSDYYTIDDDRYDMPFGVCVKRSGSFVKPGDKIFVGIPDFSKYINVLDKDVLFGIFDDFVSFWAGFKFDKMRALFDMLFDIGFDIQYGIDSNNCLLLNWYAKEFNPRLNAVDPTLRKIFGV